MNSNNRFVYIITGMSLAILGIILVEKMPIVGILFMFSSVFFNATYLKLYIQHLKNQKTFAKEAPNIPQSQSMVISPQDNTIPKISTFDTLPRYQIEISYDKSGMMKGSKYTAVKTSNVTLKTNLDTLGDFVVIDVETTGLRDNDRIVEIGAIRFKKYVPVECFQTLINPKMPIPPDATAINHITDSMVAYAPEFSQIIHSLNKFIGNSNIVGHNLQFDLGFLFRGGYNFTQAKRKYYDTWEISKYTLKQGTDVANYKLQTLREYFGIHINNDPHRALSDCYITGIVFDDLILEKIGHIPINAVTHRALHST